MSFGWIRFIFVCFTSLIQFVILAEEPLKIAISKDSQNYRNWLIRSEYNTIIVNLSSLSVDSVATTILQCDGLLLSGGADIAPGLYGNPREIHRCTTIDHHRDSVELKAIEEAIKLKIPIFGICRGLQILNVYFGGTLITDIPSDIKTPIQHQCDDYLNCVHWVYPITGTRLSFQVKVDSSVVSSNHHQAIMKVAKHFTVSARSSDGLIEGIEWVVPEERLFIMAVQWHPERMPKENRLSGKLADEFLSKSMDYHLKKQNQ